MKALVAGCFFSLILLFAHHAEGRTWNVMQDGTGDAPTIQAGIDSASAGDTVVVECGVFREHDIVMKSGIYLTGITGLFRTPRPECTTIDADGQGRCLNCLDLGSSTTIKAFTFRDGLAPVVPAYNFKLGGAMYISNSSLTIAYCAFVDNRSDGTGGGVFSEYSSTTLVNCTFTRNSAGTKGGGMGSFNDDEATLVNCTFLENSAAYDGGGISNGLSTLRVTGCLFLRNVVESSGYGGAMSVDNATVRNCTFVLNSAPYGSAIWVGEYGMQLYNSIFDRNYIQCTVPNEPGPTVTASCCDLYQSGGGGCHYFDIGTSGNFMLDPQFCDAANDDYTLEQSSPCAPGNHPEGTNCGLIGALPVGCSDIGITPTTWGQIKAMFR